MSMAMRQGSVTAKLYKEHDQQARLGENKIERRRATTESLILATSPSRPWEDPARWNAEARIDERSLCWFPEEDSPTSWMQLSLGAWSLGVAH